MSGTINREYRPGPVLGEKVTHELQYAVCPGRPEKEEMQQWTQKEREMKGKLEKKKQLKARPRVQ